MLEGIEKEKLSRSDTLIIKGIAILIMISYHLFYFPKRLVGVDYISIIPILIKNNFIEYYIVSAGKICVSIFLFLSGYGIFISSKSSELKHLWNSSLKRIKSFYFNYWLIFILFIPMGVIFFKLDIKMLLKNFLCLSSSYNSEWWFALYYIQMIFIFPIIFILMEKNWKITIITAIFLSLTYKIHMTKLFVWQMPFVMGMIFAKLDGFKIIGNKINKDKYGFLKGVFGINLVFLLRGITSNYINIFIDYGLDWIFVPFFIFFILLIVKGRYIKIILEILGKNAGNMWLTHSFFCYYYFQKITFYPKISILIFIWNVLLALGSSIIIVKLSKIIEKINLWIRKQLVGQLISK